MRPLDVTIPEKIEIEEVEVVELIGAERIEIDGRTYWLGLYEMVSPAAAQDLLQRNNDEGRPLFRRVVFGWRKGAEA